jgi:hypothetical protein
MLHEFTDDNGNIIAKATVGAFNRTETGFWLEFQTNDGKKPTICVVNQHMTGFYIGVYADTKDAKACDLAISFKDGPQLQVQKDDQIEIVDLFDLIKFYQDNKAKV